jgi:hypothetical protein
VLLLCACGESKHCEPTLLTNDDIYKRAEQAKFLSSKIPVFLESGERVPRDSVSNYSPSQYAYSQYVDCRDSVVKLEIREVTQEDKDLRKRIDSLYSHNLDLAIKRIKWIEKDTLLQQKMIEMAKFQSPAKTYPVNCDSISYLIRKAFRRDQSNRGKGSIDLEVDKRNLNLVESIVENCTLGAIESLGEPIVYRFFMIIQHAPKEYRKKYIPFFRKMTKEGLLRKRTLALMIDRMLIDSGKKQLYGTQYKINKETGKKKLYPVQDIDLVDSLRREANMLPLHID